MTNRVNLVHIHMSERGSVLRTYILSIMAFAFSKPVIIRAHGCEFHVFYDNLPRIIQKVLNKILQNCAGVIIASESWKHTYIKKCNFLPDRVLILYNPVTRQNYNSAVKQLLIYPNQAPELSFKLEIFKKNLLATWRSLKYNVNL